MNFFFDPGIGFGLCNALSVVFPSSCVVCPVSGSFEPSIVALPPDALSKEKMKRSLREREKWFLCVFISLKCLFVCAHISCLNWCSRSELYWKQAEQTIAGKRRSDLLVGRFWRMSCGGVSTILFCFPHYEAF